MTDKDDADNVEILDVETSLGIPPQRVLRAALDANMRSVIVVGYDAGGEHYLAASISDGPEALWLLERAKRSLLANFDED